EDALEKNLKTLARVRQATGCKVILALKAFSLYAVFPLIRKYLTGTTASSLHEARLGFEEFGPEVHICAPAYRKTDFDELLTYVTHMTFNSFSIEKRLRPKRLTAQKKVSCGIRINPEYSEVEYPIYDPCARYSRLGVTQKEMEGEDMSPFEGIHFHTLCGKGVQSLQKTIDIIEHKFGPYLRMPQIKWVNFGGGHLITKAGYDIESLCDLINRFQEKYEVQVILEPGEGIVLRAGFLVSSVIDIVKNEKDIAILDTSAAAHMPDILEMPYRPEIHSSGDAGCHPFTYQIAGMTCLAGDIMGDYSFPKPLNVDDKIVFKDMAQYTMVKNNHFNGLALPSIGKFSERDGFKLIKTFNYNTFKNRLS
ncbi:MAG: carboxynorspermidine decarboxylase, partial [Candidatus Marinamargulisbacteria bacterium]